MAAVEVRGELFRWATDRSGVARSKLLETFPRLVAWEREEAKPSLRQLEEFARKTLTPLGYFFLPHPPEDKLPIPDFRTVKDVPVRRPSPNLLETVQTMIIRQEWMRDFLEEEGAHAIRFVGSVRMSEPPVRVAAKIRQALGFEPEWARGYPTWGEALRALRLGAEAAGILVVINGVVGNNTRRKLDPNEFGGFALIDEHSPLVFVNGADFKAAQMFTLAHELAHLWLGRAGVSSLEKLQPARIDVEQFCNAAAAELLVPEVALRGAWPQAKKEDEPFQVLARRFKVSAIVAARRAQDLGLISREGFIQFFDAYERDERRRAAARPGGGDFYANQDARVGRRFAQAVLVAAREGRLLYSDAYRLTGLHGSTFDKYAQTLGLGSRA